MDTLTLNNGVIIPKLALGTFRAKENECYKAVLYALQNGYNHIDTAMIYENEEEVGRAIKDSGVKRENIFLTTKLWNANQGFESTLSGFQTSLEKLGVDYIDLYLIHWPQTYEKEIASWKAMEKLYNEGKIRAIGVSNFSIHHLDNLMKNTDIKPVVNQVECHIKYQNVKLQQYCHEHNIYLEAYAPLMSHHIKELLDDKEMNEIGSRYNKSAPQVALRYLLQRDIIVLPKSVNYKRLDENIDVFDFELSDDDMNVIRKKNTGHRFFPEPDNIDF